MDAAGWDRRYAEQELVWGAPPNERVVAHTTALPRGRALDLACGEGRNALWLATRGWEVTGLDFSSVAVDKAAQIASRSPAAVRGRLTWRVADATVDDLSADDLGSGDSAAAYDLVLYIYLHLASPERETTLRRAAAAVAPGGRLLLLCHDVTNLTRGYGGPQDSAVLTDADDVGAVLGETLTVERAEVVERHVETPEGTRTALDTLVEAVRTG